MVLTFDFANAKSNASTHTNYLIELLKNVAKLSQGSPQLYRPNAPLEQPGPVLYF